MIRYSFQLTGLLVFSYLSASAQPSSSDKLNAAATWSVGHSPHGGAFDSNPREKLWVMPDIGNVNFPTTILRRRPDQRTRK